MEDPYKTLENALKTVERFDGVQFSYAGVIAIGIFGIPSIETQFTNVGTGEQATATLTVRKAWFSAEPKPRLPQLLEIAPKQRRAQARFFVKKINADDPVAYEFELIERKPTTG